VAFYLKKISTKNTDIELVKKYQDSGDKAAFEELFKRYCHLIYGTCLSYFSREEESRDAVLEIFELVYSRLKTHRVSHFKNWLYTITKNYCLYNLRKNKNKALANLKNIHILKNIFMEFEDVDTLIGSQSDIDFKLHAALNQLNDAQRQCITLFYFEKKSYGDIAKATGFEVKKVKSYIQNGKRNLKNILIHDEVFRDGEK